MLAALRVLHVDPGRAHRATPLSEDPISALTRPLMTTEPVTAA
jgi:hypothetical protein